MATTYDSPVRARLSIDLTTEQRRRVRLAAAHRDTSIRDYVVTAILTRLAKDEEQSGLTTLRETSDPVLGELWKNDKDSAYDDL